MLIFKLTDVYVYVCTHTNTHKNVFMTDGTTSGGTSQMPSASSFGAFLIVH